MVARSIIEDAVLAGRRSHGRDMDPAIFARLRLGPTHAAKPHPARQIPTPQNPAPQKGEHR